MLGKWLERLGANCGRFEINQLLFADDTVLVADSEEKMCRLVSQFGIVCERRKLRVNVGKSKVLRCSRYGNWDRMHMILNSEPLELDCFKYLGSQVAADGVCDRDVVHRMNESFTPHSLSVDFKIHHKNTYKYIPMLSVSDAVQSTSRVLGTENVHTEYIQST